MLQYFPHLIVAVFCILAIDRLFMSFHPTMREYHKRVLRTKGKAQRQLLLEDPVHLIWANPLSRSAIDIALMSVSYYLLKDHVYSYWKLLLIVSIFIWIVMQFSNHTYAYIEGSKG